MGRLEDAFAAAKAEGRVVFVPYITSAFPTLDDTVPMLLGMQKAGADIIELGVPFTDPLADGGTIQEANQQALKNGVTVAKCLAYVKEARDAGLTVPVVMMGYYNPFLRYGESKFVEDAKAAGVDGFIVVDLPPEEAASFSAECDKHELCFVPLVAPTSTDDRLRHLATIAKGYVYCVSIAGVTGNRGDLPPHLAEFVTRVRSFLDLPLTVGFGLSTRAHVTAVADMAEGAVMGTSIIKAASKGDDVAARVESVSEFIRSVLPEAAGAAASSGK